MMLLAMKYRNTILTEEQQKYQRHQLKLINVNILQVKSNYLVIAVKC